MKKALYVILTIEIISAIIGFFILLFKSFILALVFIPSFILGIVPILAIIRNFEEVEDLHYELYLIKSEIKKLKDQDKKDYEDNSSPIPSAEYKETAKGAWECVKCGTINKENTSCCSNCKAAYSAFINPTVNPYEKKKTSRWIKEKDLKTDK